MAPLQPRPRKNPFKGGRGAPWPPFLTDSSKMDFGGGSESRVLKGGGVLGHLRFPLLGAEEGDRIRGQGAGRGQEGAALPGVRGRGQGAGGAGLYQASGPGQGAGSAVGRIGPSHPHIFTPYWPPPFKMISEKCYIERICLLHPYYPLHLAPDPS